METKFFKEIPFFSHLDNEKLKLIANSFKPKKFKKNDIIIEQDNEGEGMYVIVFGEVEVLMDGKKIKHLEGNDFFGEIALITKEPRTATIKVKSDELLTLFLSKEVFNKIKDELGEEIKREMLQRIIENYEGW